MKRMYSGVLIGIVAIGAAWTGILANAQRGLSPSVPRVVATDDQAFALLPPELIAAPTITAIEPSPDGKYVIVHRMAMKINTSSLTPEGIQLMEKNPPAGEQQIILWDGRTRESRIVWRGPIDVRIGDIQWMKGSNIAIGLASKIVKVNPDDPMSQYTTINSLWRLSATADKAQEYPLPKSDEMTSFGITVSPVEPLAILERYTSIITAAGLTSQHTMSLVKSDGRTIVDINLEGQPGRRMARFDAIGNPVLIAYYQPDKVKGGKYDKRYFNIDTRNGFLKPYVGEYRENEMQVKSAQLLAKEKLALRVEPFTVRSRDTSQKVGMLWLEGSPNSESPRTLVATDSGSGQFLSNGQGVVYDSNGALWFAPMVHMSLEQFKEMRDTALRAQLMNNAKQLGLGLLMYTQDYDEMLPDPDGINTKVEPYIKNMELFNGFSYTFPGGALKDIEKPSETELGYVTGPGGRAVIYVDGHVKWRKD